MKELIRSMFELFKAKKNRPGWSELKAIYFNINDREQGFPGLVLVDVDYFNSLPKPDVLPTHTHVMDTDEEETVRGRYVINGNTVIDTWSPDGKRIQAIASDRLEALEIVYQLYLGTSLRTKGDGQ